MDDGSGVGEGSGAGGVGSGVGAGAGVGEPAGPDGEAGGGADGAVGTGGMAGADDEGTAVAGDVALDAVVARLGAVAASRGSVVRPGVDWVRDEARLIDGDGAGALVGGSVGAMSVGIGRLSASGKIASIGRGTAATGSPPALVAPATIRLAPAPVIAMAAAKATTARCTGGRGRRWAGNVPPWRYAVRRIAHGCDPARAGRLGQFPEANRGLFHSQSAIPVFYPANRSYAKSQNRRPGIWS